MARTLDEWKAYVSSLMPGWRNSPTEEALKYGTAKVFLNAENFAEEMFSQTFLGNATGPRLEQMGYERGVDKFAGESDDAYRERIRSLESVSENAILAAVTGAISEALGDNPSVTFSLYQLYTSGFSDVEFLDTFYPCETRPYNMFLIEFEGTATDEQKAAIYSATVTAVTKAMAFGVMFDIVSYL